MLSIEFRDPEGLLVLKPDGPISLDDVAALRAALAGYLGSHDDVHGLLIEASKIPPGYADLEALLGHIGIVRDYHRRIERIALVTDASLAKAVEFVGRHFVGANVRHFSSAEMDVALSWLEAP